VRRLFLRLGGLNVPSLIERALHRKRPGVEIYVGPLEPQEFAPPQARVYGGDIEGFQTVARGRGEQRRSAATSAGVRGLTSFL
jgi:hypothetical protein